MSDNKISGHPTINNRSSSSAESLNSSTIQASRPVERSSSETDAEIKKLPLLLPQSIQDIINAKSSKIKEVKGTEEELGGLNNAQKIVKKDENLMRVSFSPKQLSFTMGSITPEEIKASKSQNKGFSKS